MRAGSGAMTFPEPSLIPPGTGGRSALRRVRLSGASTPLFPQRIPDRRPLRINRIPHFGPVIHGQRGDERLFRQGTCCYCGGEFCRVAHSAGVCRGAALDGRCPPCASGHRRGTVRVAIEHIAFIHRDPFRPALGKQARQVIPRRSWVLVMHKMQIIVEEEKAQRRALDDDRAALRRFRSSGARHRCGW